MSSGSRVLVTGGTAAFGAPAALYDQTLTAVVVLIAAAIGHGRRSQPMLQRCRRDKPEPAPVTDASAGRPVAP